MIRRHALLLPLFALGACPGLVWSSPEAITSAKAAAMEWLQKIDGSNYSGSWQAAAAMFKAAVTVQAWQQAAQSVRAPLGAVRSRTAQSTTFTRTLPGAPDGQYVVIQFAATFDNKAAATETIAVALDPDGVWRVAGYFIK